MMIGLLYNDAQQDAKVAQTTLTYIRRSSVYNAPYMEDEVHFVYCAIDCNVQYSIVLPGNYGTTGS